MGLFSPFPNKKNEQKLPKMGLIISNFLVLHVGDNFIEIRSKLAKLQMHENFHKNVNEKQIFMSFEEGQLKQQMLYTAHFLYAF